MKKIDNVKILNDIMRYKNFSTKTQFADFLGISTQNLGTWFSRNRLDATKLSEKIPELNWVWLLTGEGEMLKGDDQPLDREESGQFESHILRLSDVLDDIQRRILAIDETIKTKDEQINRLLGIIEKMYEK